MPSDLRVCCGMVNRGFAVFGDRLFMTTLDAHIMALDRKTGTPIWDVPMADYRLGYSATVAPLVVKDMVIVGMAGGELATRGFLDAYSVETGKRIWRFNTIPAPGEPGGDTWPHGHYERGGGPTWITGSYDRELNLLYWGVGNPNPDFYGGNRLGDNLYTASVVALDADTGRLRWHFQVHAARRARLGFESDPGARRSHDWRTGAQDADHGESKWVLLRAGSHHRRVHPGETLRDYDMGEGRRRQRSADRAARSATHARGHAHLPRSGWRQQLHVSVVRSGAASVLRVGARDVPGVHELSARKSTSSATS